MIFYLFFIIILRNWDYKPHFIDKETQVQDVEAKLDLR